MSKQHLARLLAHSRTHPRDSFTRPFRIELFRKPDGELVVCERGLTDAGTPTETRWHGDYFQGNEELQAIRAFEDRRDALERDYGPTLIGREMRP